MKIRQLILSAAAMMVLGTGCIVEVSDRNAYETCTSGQICGSGTICQAATFTTQGGPANQCTVSCGAGSICPGINGQCVVNTSGIGQCFRTCTSTFECGSGSECRVPVGTAIQVCLPIAGTAVTPTPPAVYTGCSPAGAVCASNTTCLPTSYVRAGGVQGNTCTIACPSGDARMCPGYSQDPTRTECVAPNGNLAQAQCMRLCPNGESDCAPYLTHCAAVPMAAGTLAACVP